MAGGLDENARDERIGRLFADITNELEHTHETSVDGQNNKLTTAHRRRLLARLSRRLDRCAGLITKLSILLQR